MLNFIESAGALTAGQLTSTNVGLSFHNVQRKRLEKYGKQYIATDHQPVQNLLSEGQADTSSSAVKKSRRGFQDTRRLLVISQWYRYAPNAPSYALSPCRLPMGSSTRWSLSLLTLVRVRCNAPPCGEKSIVGIMKLFLRSSENGSGLGEGSWRGW